ncbi:MAG: hypothetical protein LIP01_15910 [Tannerellaceae bacterium]|nr:hypothetical protein [Tannerellaceae bacterium]
MAAVSEQIGWVTKYDNPTKSLSENFYEGMRIGEIWGFETEGYFKTDEEAAAWDQSSVVGYSAKAGDIKFADLDGNKKITKGSNTVDDPGDQKIIGNNLSRYYFTLMGSSEWRGIDFSVFFQGVLKRKIVADNSFYLNHYSSEWSVPQQMNFDYWREDNTDAFFPRARFDGGSAVHEKQTQFLQNAAYIRLKQLQLGYTIPYKYSSKAKITKARLYFNAENLWEYSKLLDGFDPEIAQVNLYPLTRAFSFGVNVTF